jgi:hypothetical protein
MTYATWAGLLNGDNGSPATLDGWDLVSFQVAGTIGTGGSVQIEASNEATPVNWGLVGAAVAAAGVVLPADDVVARNFRPRVTAGDGTTSLTVIAAFRAPR